MNCDKNQFVREVLSRMADEHGVSSAMFESLVPKIQAAHATEGLVITPDELSELIHGDGEGIPPELSDRFPLLDAIAAAPYVDSDIEADKSAQVGRVELEEADMDEDEEDEEDEEEEE